MIYNIIYDSAMTHPSRYSSIHDACHSKITNNNKYNDKQIICHLQITNHTKYNDKQIKLNQEHVRPRWGRIWLLPQWCKQVVIAIRNKWMINTKYYKWQNYDARRYYYFIIIIIALGQPEMVHYYPQYSTPYLVPQQVGLLMLLMLPLSSCHTHLQWQGSFILNQCTPSFYQYQPSSQQASPPIYCEKGPPIPDDVHWSVQLCDSTNLKQTSPRLALEVLEWHIFQKALTQLSQLLLKWKLASLEHILHAWIVHLIL